MVEMILMTCFHFFYKQVALELAPKLAIIFRPLVKESSFTACWSLADVVPVPTGSPSSDIGDYKPLPITLPSVKILKKIVAGKVRNFWNVTVCFLLLSFRFVGAWEHVMLCSQYAGSVGQRNGGKACSVGLLSRILYC